MSKKPKAYPKNIEGDFYVEDGCCLACDIPNYYAPDLFSYDESLHCFVSKQPANQDELFRMIEIVMSADLECIRYSGTNPQMLKRLAEAGVSYSCDNKHLVQNIKPLLINHVTFECPQFESAVEVAEQFKENILKENSEYIQHKFSNYTEDELGISYNYNWYQENYCRIWFNKIESANVWHVFHSIDYEKEHSRGITIRIDEWLRANEKVSGIKWFTNPAWKKSSDWLETPF